MALSEVAIETIVHFAHASQPNFMRENSEAIDGVIRHEKSLQAHALLLTIAASGALEANVNTASTKQFLEKAISQARSMEPKDLEKIVETNEFDGWPQILTGVAYSLAEYTASKDAYEVFVGICASELLKTGYSHAQIVDVLKTGTGQLIRVRDAAAVA